MDHGSSLVMPRMPCNSMSPSTTMLMLVTIVIKSLMLLSYVTVIHGFHSHRFGSPFRTAFVPVSFTCCSKNNCKWVQKPIASIPLPSCMDHSHRLQLSNKDTGSTDGTTEGQDDGEQAPNFYNDFETLFPDSDPEPKISSPPPATSPSSNIEREEEVDSQSQLNLLASLQKRQTQLQEFSRDLLKKWRMGVARTSVGFTINEHFYLPKNELGFNLPSGSGEELPFDWVRRVSVGAYPAVACGSAYGSVFVADVEIGRLLAVARGVHYCDKDDSGSELGQLVDALDDRLRYWLYGNYDGGGVLAVSMFGNSVVASAGREGGVKIFKLKTSEGGKNILDLIADVPTLARPLPGASPILVTCLKFDSMGRLFMGGNDGNVRMVSFPKDFLFNASGSAANLDVDAMQVTVISSLQSLQTPSPILSLDVSEDLDMVASAHANGNVCVHSIIDLDEENDGIVAKASGHKLLGVWNPFSSSLVAEVLSGEKRSHARSVAFVSKGDIVDGESYISETREQQRQSPQWAIVVGGGNGQMWVQDIHRSFTRAGAVYSVATSSGDTNEEFSNSAPAIKSASNVDLFQKDSARMIKPPHQGPVLALASRPGGIVISTGHDGLLRVSEVWPASTSEDDNGGSTSSNDSTENKITTSKALYGLAGYKVWIGNICIDAEGKRLLSDGRDDVVIVHDFSKDPAEGKDDD